MSISPSRWGEAVAGTVRRNSPDSAVCLLLLLAGFLVTYVAAGWNDPRLLPTISVWFEGDVEQVYANLIDRGSDAARLKTHPLAGLFTYPPVFLLRTVLGLAPYDAVRVFLGFQAGIWLALLYATLRLMHCRRTDATLFTLLGATSAAAMFWFPVPETHSLGSLTILLVLLTTVVSLHRRVPLLVDVMVSVASLGVTVTNWMAGVWSLVLRRPWRTALKVSVVVFITVVGLWLIAKQLMPRTAFFLGRPPDPEQILSPEQRGPLAVAAAMFVHTIVMPVIWVVDRPGPADWPVLITQPSGLRFATLWGAAAAVSWLGLLAVGIWSLWTLQGLRSVRLFIGGLLAGQFALHLVFGNETFLYAPNWLPLLVVLGALGSQTGFRKPVLITVGLLIVTGAVNNTGQWRRASGLFREFAAYHFDVGKARKARPADFWPDPGPVRVFAVPGTGYYDRGFYTEDGSFSPGYRQFAVTVWTLDSAGTPRETSGQRSASTTTEVTFGSDSLSGRLQVTTPAYRAAWEPAGKRRWLLELEVAEGAHLALTVRSVGASRGPIRQLEWDGRRLLVNGRWSVLADSGVAVAYLMNEEDTGWVTARPSRRAITVKSGWAAARLELRRPGRYIFQVADTAPAAPVDQPLATLPPRRFPP